MRNPAPAPKFSLFAATVILITLAVCPIGYAKAEKISFVDNQKGKRSLDGGEIPLKTKRSLKYKEENIGGHNSDKPLYYKKWGNDLGDDDLQYSSQSDPIDSDGYETDGYGYDDDDYDHLNYKRFDNDKDKLSQDDKINKDANSIDKSALMADSKVNAPPEATTIELLSFQAKNLNPGAEGAQSSKEDAKVKPLSVKKPPYAGKDSKDSLVDEKLKKKTTSEQKNEDLKTSGNAGNDKNSGNVKASDNKVSENKDNLDKSEKAKVSDARMNIQNLKEDAPVAKNDPANINDAKNAKLEDLSKSEAKISEKDEKSSEAKLEGEGKEEKDAVKIKEEKDIDPAITETKAVESAKEEAREKNLSQFVSNRANLVGSDYKDGFDNINTPGITDDEKGSEDLKENGINLAGLRDNRNELPYKYRDPRDRLRDSKYSKKDVSDGYVRRKIASRSNLISRMNWETDPLAKDDNFNKNSFERGPKEPFHLDFPLADLENTDYHRNFIKSLKRFKGLDESSRILSQGDTPSPYADEAKKRLASKVIEEEQRKRRSRLRRLKASPLFSSMIKRERGGDALYAYGPSARARMQYGTYGDVAPKASSGRGFSEEETDPLGDDTFDEDEYEDMTKNIKNKRQDTAGFYDDEIEEDLSSRDEEDSFGEGGKPSPAKRKSQGGKSTWNGNEYNAINQKKKYKDLGLYEDPSRYNNPLVLLQRNDNGQQSMKTFTDGRYKNEDGIDSEDLARLLSRDSNYVVLKKVPGKDQVQKIDPSFSSQGGRARSALGEQNKKEKVKVSQLDLVVKAQHPVNMEDPDMRNVVGSYSDARVEQPLKKKENRIKDLSDFFKEHSQDKEIDEKKEMLVSIDNRLSQFQRGEPSKKLMYKPPLSQAYRHMKDFENVEAEPDLRGLYKKNAATGPVQAYAGPERVLKSFKKEGKEAVLMNTPFTSVAYKPAMPPTSAASDNPLPTNNMLTASNMAPNGNLPQAGNLMPASNALPSPNGYMMPPNMLQNGLMQNNNNLMQIKLPDVAQKGSDSSSKKYFLYGSDNDMANTPKHEVKVIQSDFGVPQDNTQTYSLQNYNKPTQTKNTQTGKQTPFDKSSNLAPGQQQVDSSAFAAAQQPGYDYAKANAQQCMANGFQTDKKPATVNENYKRVSKKESEELSGNLKRFMRDFQGLGQGYQPSRELPGMSLKELTSHGDRHFQKLNNLLKDIINNKVEVSSGETRKNVKRGMFQRYKDQKNWQPGAESPTDPQVRSGKWTSVVYDVNQQFADKNGGNLSPGESFFKEDAKDPVDKVDPARLTKDLGVPQNLYSKRSKRESPYDGSKDSTKSLEVKVKSTPYPVALQPLSPATNNANSNANSNANGNANGNTNSNANNNQQQKSTARACLQLPPDKLLDLMNFIDSERGGRRWIQEESKDFLCRRQAPFVEEPSSPPFRRKLMSVNENESEQEKKRAECVRKSFESYLDPLVQKISEYENKSQDKSKRSVRPKREIELDESMPNDFRNFLVTALGGFGNQKREVVKKDEALWEKDATHDDSNQIVDGAGNREPSEESTLGKRETSQDGRRNSKKEEANKSKDEKKSVSKENDATNIRIRIVDANQNGELIGKASEKAKSQFSGGKEEKLGSDASRNDADERENGPSVQEVYVIANKESKKRKKKKFASPRSDQTPQKQPISNHLPQVETVYNPSPGSNKAQIEKINSNDAQLKIKCLAKPPNVYNATASMMEDNIIRNNLRTGNINTFTYQRKEEPTPYPLQSPTNPPSSSEFETLDSKNPSKPKPYTSRLVGSTDRFATSSLANTNPDIIYKDEASQQFPNFMANAKPVIAKQGYRFYNVPGLRTENPGARARVYNPSPEQYLKDYAEEDSSYVEYSDSEEADSSLDRQVDSDYEASGGARDSSLAGGRQESWEDRPYVRAQDNLNPKMVEMWNNYARTHLTPASHQEAMNREFQEAYLRRNLGGQMNVKFGGSENFGASLIRNLKEHDYDHLIRGNERSSKTSKRSGPVQIGRRFFYTFKTELPDEEYYALYPEAAKLESGNEKARGEKKTDNVQLSIRQQSERMKQKPGESVMENVIGSYIVRKSVSDNENGYKLEEDAPGAKRKRSAEVYQAANDLGENRVKRSGVDAKSADESRVMEKRLSAGHLTESRYRKYHRKNFNNKRDVSEPDSCPRAKRDAVADAVKADMMKRIQEEKKAKSKIKNLKMELATSDIPLIGPSMIPQEENLPAEMLQRLEEEKRRNKMMEENPQKDDQHQSTVKSGNPDVYRTFEIKRGRRDEAKNSRHNIVSRSEPDSYRDRVFLKGVGARKVKKYSDEGFEPLAPDLRFSARSSASYIDKAEGPYKTESDERPASSIVNRKAEKDSDVPKQKLTHGFSHEAPLLTPANPLASPKIFDALKNSPIAGSRSDLKSLNKQTNEAVLAGTLTGNSGNFRKGDHAFKLSKLEEGSKKTQPLVGAVLVLAEREKTDKRHAPAGSWSRSRDEYRFADRSRMEKRSADVSEFPDRSAEIVNDDAGCRSCGGETETKNKQTNNFKQSPFPFSQLHNMKTDRNGGENGIGNSGEDILESILGRVESNPHFRKVIGPGLKWRGRKCGDLHRCCYSPPNRSQFVRQVRKILAKFVNDIEKLAAQDTRHNPCCKLDGRSNRFLHELLEVPYEPDREGVQTRFKFQLDPFLRGRCMGGGDGSGNATSGDSTSVEAMQNRRQLVLKLLAEYQNLSEDDKKRVEILGQCLMHELDVLNSALNAKEDRPKEEVSESPSSTQKFEEKATSATAREASTENATENVQTTEKDIKRGSVKIPFIWSNPEDLKLLKPEYLPSGSEFRVPGIKDLVTFPASPTEGTFTENSQPPMSKFFVPGHASEDTFREADQSYRQGKKPGELDKLGYGDAAGLQLSLKSHGPWRSNLNLGKGKPVEIWQRSKSYGLPPDPFGQDSFGGPLSNISEDDSDNLYDIEYQDYEDDDGYQSVKSTDNRG